MSHGRYESVNWRPRGSLAGVAVLTIGVVAVLVTIIFYFV